MTKMTQMKLTAMFLLGTLAVAMPAQTSTPVKDDLFAGTEVFAKGASDVTEITMDPDTLGMVAGKDKARAHSMVLNVVRTYSYDKPGMYSIEDVEVFRNKLNGGDWHCSVHIRSLKSGESTDVCNKRRSDDLSESAIITVEPKSLTFIHTIRKRNDDGSDVGEMPLNLMMGLHGTSSMAMLDTDSIVEMAMLRAQMGTLGAGSFSLGRFSPPATLMLDLPDGGGLKHLYDSVEKMKKDKNGLLLLSPPATTAPAPPTTAPAPPPPQ